MDEENEIDLLAILEDEEKQFQAPVSWKDNRWDQLAMILAANPFARGEQLARETGYSKSTIYNITRSDGFQEKVNRIRQEMNLPVLKDTIASRLEGLMQAGTELLMERVSTGKIDNNDLVKAIDVAATKLGLGQKKESGPVVQNFVAVVPQQASSAQEWQALYGGNSE